MELLAGGRVGGEKKCGPCLELLEWWGRQDVSRQKVEDSGCSLALEAPRQRTLGEIPGGENIGLGPGRHGAVAEVNGRRQSWALGVT